MAVTNEQMLSWLRKLTGAEPRENLSLTDYLTSVPRLESLANVPAGTPVLIRGDVDAKPGANIGDGDIRLRSMLETLKYGQAKGWKQIIFGHIGRKPEGSLDKVVARLSQLLGCEVTLITDWLDETTGTVKSHVADKIKSAAAGSVMVLQNTRAYAIETVLWKAKEADLPAIAAKLATYANSVADNIAKVYINEALSAGSLDASSTIVPAAMSQVALGKYIASEFDGPMLKCIESQLVVFSGIKIDKLDDLDAMIARGKITHIFSAGSLAMALKKAAALLDGTDFPLGVTEDPAHADKPYYIPPERIEQAKRMVASGRKQGIEFVLPVDFVLADASVASTLGPGQQQFDIGPATIALFQQKIGDFITATVKAGKPAIAFHNGVFGMFEDARFETGTKSFIAQLQRLTQAGVKVYVGGGEGGTALEKYGQPDWVTHCFTAGGTVLNALGSEPIPYLVALRMVGK
jgi:phosphoglycerate kinase